MQGIRVLTFDIGGTVFDWQTAIIDAINRLAAARGVVVDARRFALLWRTRMFELLADVRNATRPWMNADALHRLALDTLADEFSTLGLSHAERDELNTVWHRLRAWEEFPAALVRLRRRYPCVVMTVLSFAIAVDCSRSSGLSWDGIISCEFLGHYKPHAAAYQKTAALLGVNVNQVLMVASHRFDLHAAQAAGMRTAFVHPKLNEPDLPGLSADPTEQFDIDVPDFDTLAKHLSP